MSTLRYPLEMFERSVMASPDWPDSPNVRRTVEWFRSFMSEAEWQQRRDAAASRLFEAAEARRPELGEQGRFFDPSDTFAWYLFLAEAYLDHPLNYEYIFGSRVLPVFEAIGRDINALREVPGVEARVGDMVGARRSQPNGTLFELVVAAAYLREGCPVQMVPELPGRQRTHDLDIERAGISWAVECKRMETSDYGEQERSRMRALWGPTADYFAIEGVNVYCDAVFSIPVSEVADDYFAHIAKKWGGASGRYEWSDSTGRGFIQRLDLSPLKAVLADEAVVSPSTRLLQLLTGGYMPAANYVTSLRAKPWDHPRYIADCDAAIVLKWDSASQDAIDRKARDGLRLIARALEQLPPDRPSVIHVGFEAVNGDAVEFSRLRRFKAAMKQFDAKGVPLHCVYLHCLVPESPPNKAWLFRETGSWHGISGAQSRPLYSPILILPPGEDIEGSHWDHRETWGDDDESENALW